MQGPETRFNPQEDPQATVFVFAGRFFEKRFAPTEKGLREAIALCEQQHAQIQPPGLDQAAITTAVAKKSPAIKSSRETLDLALEVGDYEQALKVTTALFAYGEADFLDSLGGEAFEFSLSAHRALAEHLREKFSTSDPFLCGYGDSEFGLIEQEVAKKDFHQELKRLRSLIHVVAFNGTLGDKARQQFDPFAVFEVS